MQKKIRVGLLLGGRSAEHEISLLSARNVYQALERSKYEVLLIGIDKQGAWSLRDESVLSGKNPDGTLPALQSSEELVTLLPYRHAPNLIGIGGSRAAETVDVIFPVLHGTYGEDGTLQGLLALAELPFVGPGMLGSAVAMDKDVAKRLMLQAGIPVARSVVVRAKERAALDFTETSSKLGMPLFVKPANLGSSVGVAKAQTEAQFWAAVADAFRYDTRILIEEAISGRELECAVLGNESPLASGVGEIVPHARHGFYSYDAKYIDDQGAAVIVAADLPAPVAEQVRALAVRAFEALACEGMARVDFLMRGRDEIFVNELNTIPGFTGISMYPKLWERAGIACPRLVDRLIELALARHARDQALTTSL